jgi:hypothetical protein
MTGLRQLHTAGVEFTLTCWTCKTSEFLGYEKPDVLALLAAHPSHEMSLDAKAITFTSASKEDLELMRCLGCEDCKDGE